MIVTFTTHPSTADLLLYADPRHAAQELSRAVDAHRVLDEITRQVQAPPGELLHKAAEAGATLLGGIDVGSVLLGGWAKYRSLRAAARRTLDNPGLGLMVPLAEHEVVSHHEPYVEVQVNGQPVGRVTFGIDLILHLTMVTASVRAGRLMRLTGGACTAAIACKIHGVEVARKEFELVTLPINRDLGEGFPLLPEARMAS
ncbi:hypothetical protein [Nonomuraea sp. NEAU-A123]|uniref:hypothetical protein n=1 Tax=Nonomuraea sp. NEAU-A123 TaxID=2839649 RepID=UPI001BE3F232|nr:hypothetical protein [Nonomuraea sp. NEAU-A123]MBT2231968.1 hypothetical protein [Nonomuraea sp. NEAU-A123]